MGKENPVSVEKTEAPKKFSVEKLRTYCYSVFGITTCAFDGATCGMKGEYTIEEMKNAIKKWQSKEAK